MTTGWITRWTPNTKMMSRFSLCLRLYTCDYLRYVYIKKQRGKHRPYSPRLQIIRARKDRASSIYSGEALTDKLSTECIWRCSSIFLVAFYPHCCFYPHFTPKNEIFKRFKRKIWKIILESFSQCTYGT